MEFGSGKQESDDNADVIEEIEEEFQQTCYSRQAIVSNLSVLANWKNEENDILVSSNNNGDAIRVLLQILQTENETTDRLKEICMGILANLMSERSVGTLLMVDDTIKMLTKKLLFSQDPGILIELCRFLQAVLWNPAFETWKPVFTFPITERMVYIIACTLDETLCAQVADLLLHMLSLFADEAMMTYLIHELNLIPLLTTVLKDRLAEERDGDTFNECEQLIENIVNVFEFLSTHPLSFPALNSTELKELLSKIIRQRDEIGVISTACLTLANIETEDAASLLCHDSRLITSLIIHLQMYAREESASTIVVLLYELSKQLIRKPVPKSIKTLLENLNQLLDSLNYIKKDDFVCKFLDNLAYFFDLHCEQFYDPNIRTELKEKFRTLRFDAGK